MKTKSEKDWRTFKLEETKTERLSKFLLWIVAILIAALLFAIFGVGTYFGWLLSDKINFFLSSVIALFAFVEGLSTYLQTIMEKDKNRLVEVRDELEKVYAPLYSIFSTKWTHIHEKASIIINATDKDKVDNIIRSYPFLLEPIILKIWREEIERLKPYTTEPSRVFVIPAYFVNHITIQYDNLTDEYQKRVGMEMSKVSSFFQRTNRYPSEDGEKTVKEIIDAETKYEQSTKT